MEFREHTLPNGLEIIAECNPAAYSMGVAYFVRAGSRDENDEISGVSHFLEHMVFKGTPTRTAADVNRELDELGSHSNAFTGEEQTVYHATVLPEYQDRIVELLADIMRPSLREDDFQTEKQVILEEIAKYEDQPPFGAHEKVMAAHFGRHPLARSVLGTTESITRLSSQQMREYFQQRYSASNIVLAAAGKVDFERLVAQAQKICGHWERFPTVRETRRAEPHEGVQTFFKDIAVQQYAIQLANGPATEDDDRYAGRLLATILGDDTGSRMFWELVDTGLAEQAAMGAYEFQGTGVFMTYLCCAPAEVKRNLARIRELQLEVQQNGVTEDELARAKSKICSHIVLQAERPTSRMFSIGNSWLQRRQYRTVREVVQAYQSVTVRDIATILEKYPLTQATTVTVGPVTDL